MKRSQIHAAGVTRRQLLKMGLAAGAALALPLGSAVGAQATTSATQGARSLSFYNTHTGEKLKQAVYWERGGYVAEELARINWILRDHRTGESRAIDPELLDLAHDLCGALEVCAPIHVISGYRSPKTNQSLRNQSGGVASGSLHLTGKALDLRLPGRETKAVREAALGLKRGGVGYYPQDGFVHVDTGRVRFW